MSFCSLQFLIFFPVVTGLYFVVPHRWRWLHLLVASCIFYMAFVPAYILILAFTIVVDYWAGIAIARAEGRTRRAYLVVSLVANLGVLGFFKYYDFLAANLNALLGLAEVSARAPLLALILPIGLSFHTFQAMSYTIEVYRGNQEPERHFGIYALYVMFYPQLVAGPIERPQNLLHQFREEHAFDEQRVTSGLQQMAWGFFKKIVVADRMAVGADTVYGQLHLYSGWQLLLGTVAFVVQVYADFSGYSDIALGSARVMGFELMTNFNRPYGASNPAEFWRRWHISLYSWLNDYLYTPFVLAFRGWGNAAVYIGIVITLTLSGLWHGAAWTFIVFGAIHSVALVSELATRRWRRRTLRSPLWTPAGIVGMFAFICFVDIFFRAPTLRDALYVVTHVTRGLSAPFAGNGVRSAIWGLLGSVGFSKEDALIGAIAACGMFTLESLNAKYDLVARFRMLAQPVRWASYYALAMVILFLGAQNASPRFIYFQF